MLFAKSYSPLLSLPIELKRRIIALIDDDARDSCATSYHHSAACRCYPSIASPICVESVANVSLVHRDLTLIAQEQLIRLHNKTFVFTGKAKSNLRETLLLWGEKQPSLAHFIECIVIHCDKVTVELIEMKKTLMKLGLTPKGSRLRLQTTWGRGEENGTMEGLSWDDVLASPTIKELQIMTFNPSLDGCRFLSPGYTSLLALDLRHLTKSVQVHAALLAVEFFGRLPNLKHLGWSNLVPPDTNLPDKPTLLKLLGDVMGRLETFELEDMPMEDLERYGRRVPPRDWEDNASVWAQLLSRARHLKRLRLPVEIYLSPPVASIFSSDALLFAIERFDILSWRVFRVLPPYRQIHSRLLVDFESTSFSQLKTLALLNFDPFEQVEAWALEVNDYEDYDDGDADDGEGSQDEQQDLRWNPYPTPTDLEGTRFELDIQRGALGEIHVLCLEKEVEIVTDKGESDDWLYHYV